MAINRKQVNLVPHQFTEFEWRIGACCTQHVSRPGKVTVARLMRFAGEYHCLITTGNALDVSLEEMKKTFWGFSPHTYIKLDCGYEAFLQELRCNHMHLTYGDHKQSLVDLCELLDITPIVI